MTRWRAANLRIAMLATETAVRVAGRVSSGPARRPVARLWFTPWRVPVGERAQRHRSGWLAATRSLNFHTNRGKLSGFSAGRGPTVLLVHGWGAEAASLGAFIAPLVENGYRVVGVDLPAHGSSPGRQTDGLQLAAALREVSDQVGGIDSIVAHSVGAFAAAFAMKSGLKVRTVALLAPMVRLDHAVDRFAAMFRLPPKAIAALRDEIERRFGADTWTNLSLDRIAEDLDVPVLVVHDRDDPQVDVADAANLVERWPESRLIVTSGLAHDRVLRDEQVVQRVTAFLSTRRSALASSDSG